jgi:hypothetical protein
VTGSFRFGSEPGAEVFLEREAASTGSGTDLVIELRRLVDWGRNTLLWMWWLAEEWRLATEHSLLGTIEDIDAEMNRHMLPPEVQKR